ncbi:hypothetical protein [Nocardia sp. alder85J]|uniref:hypothetical protein n=1 Tax=Nocardia sp. alder85J TaxID=2862949 RepID=UPI001CD5F736|nr:hypothetical protein [Nocardia sp. alder85J]MCX4094779.1 hypothetical protein [Nocardia sp. alder85J]
MFGAGGLDLVRETPGDLVVLPTSAAAEDHLTVDHLDGSLHVLGQRQVLILGDDQHLGIRRPRRHGQLDSVSLDRYLRTS